MNTNTDQNVLGTELQSCCTSPMTGFFRTGVCVIGTQDLGRGQVVYLASDPLFRGFWQNGKLLFGNAVFVVGN